MNQMRHGKASELLEGPTSQESKPPMESAQLHLRQDRRPHRRPATRVHQYLRSCDATGALP